MELFLLAGLALLVVAFSVKLTKTSLTEIADSSKMHNVLPKAVSVLILTAHASELIKVVEHASIVNITAALILLAIVVAGRSGTENQLH
jgi:nitrate reductase gamma subunit